MDALIPGACFSTLLPSRVFAIMLVLPFATSVRQPAVPTPRRICSAGDAETADRLVNLLAGSPDRLTAEQRLFAHGFRTTPPIASEFI